MIERIDIDNSVLRCYPALHPSGDIYFFDYDYTGFRLYRVFNTWTPDVRDAWYVEYGDIKTGILNDSNVRIRAIPSLSGEQLGFLDKNDRVEILDKTSEKMQVLEMNDYWFRMKTAEGVSGWVYGYFIDVDK